MSPRSDHLRRSRGSITFVWPFLCLCGWWPSGFARGDESTEFGTEIPKAERVAVLDMLVEQMVRNYEQIQTWRGCYDVVDATYSDSKNPSLRENQRSPNFPYDQVYSPVKLPDENLASLRLKDETRRGYWFVLEGKIDFVFDGASQREYVRILHEPRTDFVDIPTGIQVRQNSGQGSFYYLYAPDSFTELSTKSRIGPITGHAIVDGVPAGRLVSVRLPKNAGGRSTDFDCRALFGGIGGLVRKEPGFWPLLKSASDTLSGKATHPSLDAETLQSRWDPLIKIYVSGDSEPIYTFVRGDQSKGHTVIRFDSKSGFHWISHATYIGGIVRQSKTVTYRRQNGIFIPETFEDRMVATDSTLPFFIRRLKLSHATLNGPVSDSDFSVYQFDLKYCDRMLDEIKDELHVYDDVTKKFIIAEKFSFDASRSVER